MTVRPLVPVVNVGVPDKTTLPPVDVPAAVLEPAFKVRADEPVLVVATF